MKREPRSLAIRFPGERRHISISADDILENTTILDSRDARVKYWKLKKLAEKEIAEKLAISVVMVEQSVSRLLEDGELKSKIKTSQERHGRISGC